MDVYYSIDPNDERLNAITEEGTSKLKTQVELICNEIHFTFEGYCTSIDDLAEVLIEHANDGIYDKDLNMEEVNNAYKEIFNEECPKSWSEIDISIEDTNAMSLFVLAYVLTFKYYLFEGSHNGSRINLRRDDYEKNRSVYNYNVDIFPDTNMIDCQLIRDKILKYS
jgi:hypothetical protein